MNESNEPQRSAPYQPSSPAGGQSPETPDKDQTGTERQTPAQSPEPPAEGTTPPPAEEKCDPDQAVSDLKSSYEDKKAQVEAAQKKLEKMKTDLDELEKMSQELAQTLEQHRGGQKDREARFTECSDYVKCKTEIVDGTVSTAVKEQVDKVIKDYWEEVEQKRAECQQKHDAFVEAGKTRQTAEETEQKKKKTYEDNKALVSTCLAGCDELKPLYEDAEEKCDHKLMYFLVQQLRKVVDGARQTCVYSDDYEKLLCDSWDELREAKSTTGEAREAEDLARRQKEKCDLEYKELRENPRATLIARLASVPAPSAAAA